MAFLVVMVAGAAYVVAGSRQWSAETTLLVVPGKNVDITDGASYFDTLSQGQIPSTAAQILGSTEFRTDAERSLRLSPAQSAGATISTSSVTGTFLVTLTADASSAPVATRMADAVVKQATSRVDALIRPYQVAVVSPAADHASQTSNLDAGKFLVVCLVVALALGIGAQQAAAQLLPLLRPGRRTALRHRPTGAAPGEIYLDTDRAWTASTTRQVEKTGDPDRTAATDLEAR